MPITEHTKTWNLGNPSDVLAHVSLYRKQTYEGNNIITDHTAHQNLKQRLQLKYEQKKLPEQLHHLPTPDPSSCTRA